MARWAMVGGLVLAISGLIGWISPPRVEFPLEPGRLYDVGVHDDAAEFDLPFESPTEQYLLVVSNLAEDIEPRRVRLAARDVDQARATTLREVAPRPTATLAPLVPSFATATPNLGVEASDTRRSFWLFVAEGSAENPAGYRQIHASLAARGPHVRVYVDKDDAVPTATCEAVVELYERAVLPTTQRHLGAPRDVDGDGTLAILMTGWLGRLEGGRTSLGGMVSPRDFLPGEAPFSNHADVLYLNAGVRPGGHLETLLAHELAHAVTVSGRLEQQSLLFPHDREEDWLNEAIAHVAENLQGPNWSNLDYRVAQYLLHPQRAPLVVARYDEHGLWRDAGVRGSTFLFLRWCVQRYGPGLLSRLIHSPRRGTANLEAATGVPFAELYRQFTVDLFLPEKGTCYFSEADDKKSSMSPFSELVELDLHRDVGDFPLAGPRYTHWDVAGAAPEDVRLHGTSSAYFLVTAERPGPRRLKLTADAGTRLQVTLVRLPDDRPQLALQADRDGEGNVRVRLDAQHGVPLAVTRIASIRGTDAATGVTRPLVEEWKGQHFDQQCGDVQGEVAGELLLPSGDRSSDDQWLNVTATDAQGRRVAAWARAPRRVERVARRP